jgi:hypothetical protein
MLLPLTASATDFHVSSLSGSRSNNRVIIALGGRVSLLATGKAGPMARDDPDGRLRVVRILPVPCRNSQHAGEAAPRET